MSSNTRLRFGISLPQNLPDQRLDLGYLRDYVRQAEALGFEDGWLTESILSPHFQLEPVSYLSYLAAITERIGLGVSVIILNARNPVQLAKSLTTLDQLSQGRVRLGVAMGAPNYNFAAFGVPPERRVARFEEAVRVMKTLWSEERATVAGDFWHLDNVPMQPKPVQKPFIPMIFGGHSEPALRRAVRLGDGWMAAGSVSTPQSIENVGQIRRYLREAGRDPSGFFLSKRLYIAIDDDEVRGRQKLTAVLKAHYRDRETSTMGLAASPSHAVQALGELCEAGYSHIALNPMFDDLKQMELLAAKVVPQL